MECDETRIDMATILTAEVLIDKIKQSGLIEEDQLNAALERWKSAGISVDNPRAIAVQLVKEDMLTRWQAEKLLQGKHRGFFLGRYRLLRLLGTGGMSSVYLAEHTLMRRPVAIKVLPQARVNDASYLQRFHREAQAVAALDHENIVRAYDVNHDENIHFLVMEYVPGKSLQELVESNKPLGFVEIVEYVRQIATGLEHAHHAKMVHRDIKPANLLLDDRGMVKMLDLGLARFFHTDDDSSLTLQYDEKVLGTADYLSPEQALNSHNVDNRADIYSLGGTMYFLLTGHPPFPEGSLAQRLLFHQTKEPAPISEERPDTPSELIEMVEKMMKKDPDERYQTVQEIELECTQWLEEHGGEKWKKMRLGQRATTTPSPAPAKKTKSKKSNSKPAAKPLEKLPREEASTVVPETNNHDPEMAAFLQAMSGAETEYTSKAKEFPEFDFGEKSDDASSSDPPADVTRQMDPADLERIKRKSQTKKVTDEFDFTRETEAPVSSQTSVIPAETHIPGFTAAGAPTKPKAKPRATNTEEDEEAPWWKRHPIWSVAISIATLLIGIAVILFGFGDGSNGNGARGIGNGSGKKEERNPGKEDQLVQIPNDLIEKTIDPNGDITSINKALDFARKNPAKEYIFRITEGQVFDEQLVFDNTENSKHKTPPRIHFKVEGGTATIKPDGSGPVITVIGGNDGESDVEALQFTGFNIDAAGGQVALKLVGSLPRLRFQDCRIHGFQKTGVEMEAARAFLNDRIQFDKVDIQGTSDASSGVSMIPQQNQSEPPSCVTFSSCLFVGPMKSGIDMKTNATNISIENSRFHKLDTAIDLVYGQDKKSSFSILNNTFYECRVGLHVGDMLHISKYRCAIQRNLFDKSSGGAVQISQNFNQIEFLNMGIELESNWTNQPHVDGAADIFNLGKTNANIEFRSTDPNSPDFLLPAEGAENSAVGYQGPNWPPSE